MCHKTSDAHCILYVPYRMIFAFEIEERKKAEGVNSEEDANNDKEKKQQCRLFVCMLSKFGCLAIYTRVFSFFFHNAGSPICEPICVHVYIYECL